MFALMSKKNIFCFAPWFGHYKYLNGETKGRRRESILGDPGAVSRVDKTFVVKVYCKSKLSPRTFYRPD